MRQNILLHALKENGVSAPSTLIDFVQEDIDRYGSQLTLLKAKLQKAREVQLSEVGVDEMNEENLFYDDGEPLIRCVSSSVTRIHFAFC